MEHKELLERIKKIEKRNKKVEADKAWETSWTRKLLIASLTYLIIVLFFTIMHLGKPFINAIVPTLGFILSTLSIDLVKRVWLEKFNNKLVPK